MNAFRIDGLFDFFNGMELIVVLLWLGLGFLSIALIVLMRTRWGQAQPLRKCLALSLLAHLLLVGYATTVQIVASNPVTPEEPIQVTVNEEQAEGLADPAETPAQRKPWESFVHQQVVRPERFELARAEPAELAELERQMRSETTGLSGNVPLENLALVDPIQPEPRGLPESESLGLRTSSDKSAEPISAPKAQRRQAVRTELPANARIERPAYANHSQSRTERNRQTGLPTALLERPLPLRKLSNVNTTPDPERSLLGVRDMLAQTSRGEPAEWSSPETNSQSEVASPGSQRPVAPETDHIRPLSMAGRGADGDPGFEEAEAMASGSLVSAPLLPADRSPRTEVEIPAIYSLRVAPDRSRLARQVGATDETEAAVKAALAWMADNQQPDGRWSPKTHGGGRETFAAGRDRLGAGMQADTGITGLALLAFLASGHTHQQGAYASNVTRGLQYLVNSQRADGSLGGQANVYAYMYCHAMATFALSEAYGMTRDHRLRDPIQRALRYTVAAQDPSGGGWRYNPGDPGDTSQLGWQLMALKSAELAGIPIPERCRQGVLKYIDSVTSGHYGGLAAYRPGEAVSRPMTAEALACRQFLGLSADHPAGREAGDFILAELPGSAETNLYYWYYGTLATYNLQGRYWQRWNEALKKTLLRTQKSTPHLNGSWDPDTVWGGYGGRVYSTALATLCLEVYYRFLPLYSEASRARPPLR